MTRAGEIIQRLRVEARVCLPRKLARRARDPDAQFHLEPDNPEELTKRMQKQWIAKKAAQPLSHQSAGCIFKNPARMSAGMPIDQAGLKGTRVGQAEVSDRHANFIIANPSATSATCSN